MTYPITRQFGPNAKGSELTFTDMDNNLLYLDSKVTGSSNFIPMYSGSSQLTSSVLFQSPSNGYIGINKVLPSTHLDINGNLIISGSTTLLQNGPTLNLRGIDHEYIQFYPDNSTRRGYFGFTYSGSKDIILENENATGKIAFKANGGVGINTYTPSASLDVNGNSIITGSLSISGSDLTLTGSLRVSSTTSSIVSSGNINLTASNGVFISGSVVVSGSVTINDILVIPPVHPLPSGRPTGSFAVSGSGVNCKPYFYNGTTWTAFFLYNFVN